MRRAHERIDDVARARRVVGAIDPDLRQRRVERQLAGDAAGVRVEDARANAPVFEEVDEEVRLGEIGCGVDPLQKRYESMPLTPSWLIPERPDTLTYETLTPMRSMTVPAMPMAPVVKVLPGL